jgi:capsular polysaccharide biosynthesis protein
MDLLAFARLLLRRGWIALLLLVLGVLAGLVLAMTQSPQYEAVTRVAVEPARQADYGQAQAAKEIMRSYTQDVRTFDMAEAAAAQLGEEWLSENELSAEALYWMIGVGSDTSVYDIEIKARAETPETAVQVAEKWSLAFVDRREKANREIALRERVAVKVRDLTTWRQTKPRRKLMAGAGGVLGLALGALLMLVIEYVTRAVVRHEGDAEQITGAPVLGRLPSGGGSSGRARHGWGWGLGQGMRDLAALVGRSLRGGWPVLLLAAVGALAAWGVTRTMPVVHRARTRIAVEPATATDWGQTQAIPQRMRSFAEDITTHRMATEVNAQLELDLPPERLLEKITVAAKEADYEIHLDAHDADADTAVALSRGWAEIFIREHRQDELLLDQRDRILVRTRDQTRPDPRLYSPRVGAATAAGTAIGALLGAAIIFLLSLSRARVVGGASEALAALGPGVALLGMIPPRAGQRERRRRAGEDDGDPRAGSEQDPARTKNPGQGARA